MPIRKEIENLVKAAQTVSELLRSDAKITEAERAAIGSAVGKLRAELYNWQKRIKK